MSIYISEDVQLIEQLHSKIFDEGFASLTIREQLERQAQQILTGHQNREPAALIHLRSWLPAADGERPIWQLTDAELFALDLSLAHARLTIAREYGFRDWDHATAEGSSPPDPIFERAVDAVVTGDIDTLSHLLTQHPNLISQRSDYGHRSTLLHYIGANGVESRRQMTPLNAVDVTKLLLDAGADVNAEAEMYGGGSTVLGLVMSSAHPAEAGVTDEVAVILREAGAR